MKIAHDTLTKGAALTLVSSSFGNLIRLTTSIILARLLAPELFGVMVLDLFATLLMLIQMHHRMRCNDRCNACMVSAGTGGEYCARTLAHAICTSRLDLREKP